MQAFEMPNRSVSSGSMRFIVFTATASFVTFSARCDFSGLIGLLFDRLE